MFGAGFTRIFMGGHLKNNNNNNNKTTAPIAVTHSLSNKNNVTLSVNNISTPNVAYSTQKFQYLNDNSTKTSSSYNVTKASQNASTMNLSANLNPGTIKPNTGNDLPGRQYYASTDLIPKSPKFTNQSTLPNGTGNLIDQSSNAKMTSNTIYK